ncbi:MAG: hypothetical protein HQL08_09320 [Nitrospirae bacterium]|nr:hypothetical protein [Nitrospirota bacterium]
MKKEAKSPISQGQFIKRMATAVILINLLVIALAGLSLRQSLLQHEERAVVTAQNLSQVLERYIGGVIDKIDVTLLTISDEIEKQVAGGGIKGQKLNRFIVRQHARLPELDGLRMADAQGNIIYGTGVTPGLKANIADREYFVRLRENAEAKLVISKPVVGRVTGEWVVLLARRLNKPDGSFSGVVYGVITLESFIKVFASIDVGQHGSITLRDEELGLVARYPEPGKVGSSIGQKTVSPEFLELVKAGRTKGTFHAFSKVDKVERTMSFRRIAGYPLYIITGLSTRDYLTGWRDEALKTSVIVALFFLATICLSWLGYRDWMRGKAAVRTMKENLEALVQERTAELVVATNRAEAASRAKSNFLSSVSHELRTPMNAILGYTQWMQRDQQLTATQKEQLDTISRSGKHLLTLINDVLEMANIEAGHIKLNQSAFDLHALLEDVESMFRVKTDAKQLRFFVQKPDDVFRHIVADHGKVRQILINLIGNAVKFTDTGGINVHVSAVHTNTGKLKVVIEVEDTGPGIAEEELEVLFGQFVQTTAGASSGGTGLGLVMSREFARLMDGDITVSSVVGKGSVFRVELFAKADEALEDNGPLKHVIGLKPRPEPGRIPVVDDKEESSAIGGPSGGQKQGSLDRLPVGLLRQMHRATLSGNMDSLNELIEQAESHDVEVAAAIRKLADDFRYETIASWLEQAPGVVDE